ncbi:Alpha-monoglucosyldiacylglycerol synthase [Blautia producta]|uniref:Alpha-monoglucosyldiacylglycerol synthase n=1 Tax=Blautia producta TaxID=33035 RepID=A0A4P6M119_9FIRM|nr:glycosyltransferase [Blautia producta]QBE98771.1 Alpha-monoglucosyldiacylglycerol synthase [Blautia producta]
MKVLVINPIMYTSETKNIKRAVPIKDTMMYDFCLAFHEMGHSITLVGGEPFKPSEAEKYPFEVLWWDCAWQKICLPHCLPLMPETYQYIKNNCSEYDLIITSEVFSLNSLMAYRAAPDKTIIWHELAKHNTIMKKVPSKIWYGIVARFLMKNAKVVARSAEARDFVKQYCWNTDDNVIDHGVNLDKFKAVTTKEDCFVVCSQLIERKKIDGILEKFANYLKQYDASCQLYIIGEGELKEKLQAMAQTLGIAQNVTFTGKMTHDELLPILSKARAMLVNTVKDNNVISIVESIAVGTPVVTTDVPLNASYIKGYRLGIAKKQWDENDLHDVVLNNAMYIGNSMEYRYKLSTKQRVEQFLNVKMSM